MGRDRLLSVLERVAEAGLAASISTELGLDWAPLDEAEERLGEWRSLQRDDRPFFLHPPSFHQLIALRVRNNSPSFLAICLSSDKGLLDWSPVTKVLPMAAVTVVNLRHRPSLSLPTHAILLQYKLLPRPPEGTTLAESLREAQKHMGTWTKLQMTIDFARETWTAHEAEGSQVSVVGDEVVTRTWTRTLETMATHDGRGSLRVTELDALTLTTTRHLLPHGAPVRTLQWPKLHVPTEEKILPSPTQPATPPNTPEPSLVINRDNLK